MHLHFFYFKFIYLISKQNIVNLLLCFPFWKPYCKKVVIIAYYQFNKNSINTIHLFKIYSIGKYLLINKVYLFLYQMIFYGICVFFQILIRLYFHHFFIRNIYVITYFRFKELMIMSCSNIQFRWNIIFLRAKLSFKIL